MLLWQQYVCDCHGTMLWPDNVQSRLNRDEILFFDTEEELKQHFSRFTFNAKSNWGVLEVSLD